MDIRDALAAVAPPVDPPGPDVVAADLARGHRAVVARRRRLAVAGAALGVVGVLGLSATVQAARSPDDPGQVGAAAGQQSPGQQSPGQQSPGQQTSGLRLVPYSGPASGSFSTALIPEGWRVQALGRTVLALAPPEVDSGPDDFIGKIVISVGEDLPEREPATGGGTVVHNAADGAIVRVDRADGTYLAVQFPPAVSRSLPEQQLLEFARGVRVGPDAEPAAG